MEKLDHKVLPTAPTPSHVERADFWELQAKVNLLAQRNTEAALLQEQIARYQRDLPKLKQEVEEATTTFRAKYDMKPDDQIDTNDLRIVRVPVAVP